MPAARNAGAKMTVVTVSTCLGVLQHQPLTQHNLDVESNIIVGIVVHDDPSNIPNTLSKASTTNSDHVRPCLMADTKVELENKRKTEEASKEGVGCEVRIIAINGTLNRTTFPNLCAPWPIRQYRNWFVHRGGVIVQSLKFRGFWWQTSTNDED